MEWGSEFSVDEWERLAVSDERLVSRVRARQLLVLEGLDEAQVFTADGTRNLSEWAAMRFDVGLSTARTLVRTMRRTIDKPWLREALEAGAISFDRMVALSKIPEDLGTLDHLDIAGVNRLAADMAESRVDERSADDRFLVMQPSLDESWWKIWGGLDGVTGAAVDNALTERADQLPDLPDGSSGSHPWRRATALYELATGGRTPEAQVTVFVDAAHATTAAGDAGVRLEAGPRIGSEALGAILCDSVTEVTVRTESGTPMRYGRRSRTIPPALRRAVLARTGGFCAADGCSSRYRVEAHHVTPWSMGGRTDPENLVGLCWFHHHIVVHERGYEVREHGGLTRIRFGKPKSKPVTERPTKG